MALTNEKIEQIREKIVLRLKELEGQLTLTQESAKTVELDQALAGQSFKNRCHSATKTRPSWA